MKWRTVLLLAAVAVTAVFGSSLASASTCPYEAPHRRAMGEWGALRSQLSATDDLAAMCRLIPRIAALEEQFASNQENAARHPDCRVHNDGASAAALRQRVQSYKEAARQCQELLAAPARSKPASAASCSDITGTKGGSSPAAARCDAAKEAAADARKAGRNNPTEAKKFYREAAEHYLLAGDTNLAAAMMDEFARLSAPAESPAPPPPPAATSVPPPTGASAPPPAAASAPSSDSPIKMWRPTQERPDCDSANATERATAGWYNTCVAPEPAKTAPRYKHPIDPQTLFRKAHQTCASSSRETYDCYVDAKVKFLMESDPVIRSQCQDTDRPPSALRQELMAKIGGTIDLERRKRDLLIACVDEAYLYGPNGPPPVRDRLKAGMDRAGVKPIPPVEDYAEAKPMAAARAHCPPGAGWAPFPCCPAGFGMKPTPGGFGGWSCQKLGLSQGAAPVEGGNTADAVAAFQRRLDEVARLAVAAADRNLSGQMPEATRNQCAQAAFDAVRGVLQGGIPLVPPFCRAFTDAARAELAYYADRHVDSGHAGMEELMAYLPRGQLGPPQPGVQGLGPDARMVREAECMARGGAPEHCAAATPDVPQGQTARSAPPPEPAAKPAPKPKRRLVRGGISP